MYDWTPPNGWTTHGPVCWMLRKSTTKVSTKIKTTTSLSQREKNHYTDTYSQQWNSNQTSKSGAKVILNYLDYINEAKRQQSNTKYYKEFVEDPSPPIFTHELKNSRYFPHQMQKKKLCAQIYASLTPGNVCMLPKKHKEGNPGSPIIYNCGTLLKNYQDS